MSDQLSDRAASIAEALKNTLPSDGNLQLYPESPGFTPSDLADWIALCEAAKVPHVPIHHVSDVKTNTLAKFLWQEELDDIEQRDIDRLWRTIRRSQENAVNRSDRVMMRWSCCASKELKIKMGDGDPSWSTECLQVTDFDPRLAEIAIEYPKDRIALYRRPWVKALILEEYPVEYRAFVQDNEVIGVSNYYPQRDLNPHLPEIEDHVSWVKVLTDDLIKAQTQPLNQPQDYASHLDPSRNHWTADFIVDEKGKLMFLEGGPPFTPFGGGHPCCYLNKPKIEGFAYAADKPIANY